MIFTLIGGVSCNEMGTLKTMFVAGILMALTNFLFSILYWVGKSELLFAFAVIADDLTAAFATVAFVAFISLLVDRTYTATQYALLASIGTAGRTMLHPPLALVDWLNGDWGIFILTSLMVLPSLICLWYIRKKLRSVKNSYYFNKPFGSILEKPKKNSKISSQILYGENFKILSKNNGYFKIRTLYDNYKGYIKINKFPQKF